MLTPSQVEGMGITGGILVDFLDEDDLLAKAQNEAEFTVGLLGAAALAVMSGQPGFTAAVHEAIASRTRMNFYLAEIQKRREGE